MGESYQLSRYRANIFIKRFYNEESVTKIHLANKIVNFSEKVSTKKGINRRHFFTFSNRH